MPVGLELALAAVAFICAVLSLIGRCPAGVAALLLAVLEIIQLAGR